MDEITSFIIMGDLHYEEDQHRQFEKAIEFYNEIEPDFLISLGDLGGYSHPGTKKSFNEAFKLFKELNCPYYPLIGNHDLEGNEFSTDQKNILAWQNCFKKELPYYSVEIGEMIFIFLSTTRFRENENCCHEVYIGEKQVKWFKRIIKNNPNKKILVFSHAPILGSGIRILQNLHLRSGNAWVNQTSNPGQFIKIVEEYEQIVFWASGHNHLSQEYFDAVSVKNKCLFCHTGVVGRISRDDHHQSRLVRIKGDQINLYTIDHDENSVELKYKFKTNTANLSLKSPIKTIMSSKFFAPIPYEELDEFIDCQNSRFSIQRQMIVEYDKTAKGPIGILEDFISPECKMIINEETLELELWENEDCIVSHRINHLGYYSKPAGIRISEHFLGKEYNL